ncbi:GNAT family N-acetyltransferase [Xaviernesmea oryzae]|uniref:GNAT family N-acetyltransferase n=1 Tax=Xaviernesmea oryzae TaxID=464029 RepID=A0A1Q9ASS0_9HYPH|nr:GNAT family N-acetyltransferase [Xaviernesmea oryzae]OLP58438.1 GNAT family N-acetyltransferase [Xaviernesmea oryzae]SEM21962.1 Ribosomal protein S18 acetylase RimI [Xaviernesmea oryzae]
MFFVRTASPADLPAVSKLLGETWHATYDAVYGVDKVSEIVASWHSVPALKNRLGRPHSEFVVADNGRRLAGMGFAARDAKQPKLAMLHQLYVHPDHQGEGIGRDLFAELETCFPEAERMRVEVAEQNERALHFYTRLGFAEIDRLTSCAGRDGMPTVVLEKVLDF